MPVNDDCPGGAPINLNDVLIYPGFLSVAAQVSLVAEMRQLAVDAPFRQYETRSGRKMGVRMTAAGDYGWISDRRGYRYTRHQPDGRPWPAIPESLIQLWTRLTRVERRPQCCLVNYYAPGVRMGLHQDCDERDFQMPVVSISLGDDGLFRVGGCQRKDPTRSVWLASGDVAVLSGASRLAFHGIDRIRSGSSALLPKGGRLNITLRVVD